MKTKEFHLGDILSITTGRLVSPRHVDGLYDIMNFMTGDSLFTHQLPRASDECKPHLLRQFPQLNTPEVYAAADELGELISAAVPEAERLGREGRHAIYNKIVFDWLAKQVEKYGEMFTVKTIPADDHDVKDTIQEAVEMMGDPKKVIVVNPDQE